MGMALLAMFAFTACGDDDDNKNDNNGNNGGGSGTGGENTEQAMKLVRGTWETVAVTPPGGQEFAVNSKDSTVWRWWNRYEFDADGNFNCWAVNYNGSGSLRGRIEHTMIGKYAYNADTKQVSLTDVIEGYHAVLAYERGEIVENRMSFTATLVSISETEMVLDMTNQGYAKIRMKKVSDGAPNNPQDNDSIPNQPQVPDSIPDQPLNPDSIPGGTSPTDYESLILGTWEQYHSVWIVLNAQDSTVTEPVEYHSKARSKSDRKYMEFVFNANHEFEKWGYENDDDEDDASKPFGAFELKMKGTWAIQGSYLLATIPEMGTFELLIENLSSDDLVFSRAYTERNYKVHGATNYTLPLVNIYDANAFKKKP